MSYLVLSTNKTFVTVTGQLVMMIIQKRTNVEPVTPAQHLTFSFRQICYGERLKASFHFVS